MRGKQKCRILKEIRQRIADENDIPYVTHECRFQGECRGSCPRCESELRYLEKQLALRASLGKRVTVAALCAGMALSAAGSGPTGGGSGPAPNDLSGAVAYVEPTPEPSPEIYVEMGEVPWPEIEPVDGGDEEIELTGEEAWPPEEPEDVEQPPFELMGDVAYVPEEADG